MSLFAPIYLANALEDLQRPHRLLDQHFGLGIDPESLLSPRALQISDVFLPRKESRAAYYRPWSKLTLDGHEGSSTVKADKERFEVVLDVQHFEPEDISVKVVDQFVVVEGKHEEKRDAHGWISRQFTRRYMIPEQCDLDQVASKLSTDGVLTIIVPRKEKPAPEGERVINIEHTGKPAVRNEQEPKKTEENQQC